ncbi:DUF72 domain-containing protein [Arsenicicoccus piscis]|uniref:DUF72 domain-containing protein n=1 Tax=Arsenicicoccus piscis TaxID=673954 RepID=A0ABQ6HQS6_9MICO|nr:DUF72 domain-containing protein [Arsenicicoccus piscis]MCH8626224.1 DUF72 domain-containing protein [Arsenicicoccus piscis]GMA20814.1 hypothetical protein GCM10025862_28350 [Arsenicicoccus piscis]
MTDETADPGILVGTSGWAYDHWIGVLYPPELPKRRWLERYVQEFGTVELNASYYRWPRQATFGSWERRLPPGFELAVKASRGLTHARRLYAPEKWADIFARDLARLGDRRGPLLLQLPPTLERDDARLDYALGAIPSWIRVAVELRHESWLHDDVFALLERHGAAYVIMSGAHLPCVLRATTDVVYVRMHGPSHDHLYAGSYSEDDLRWWADRCREWQGQGRRVYVYFNNDGHGFAVHNARRLRDLTR